MIVASCLDPSCERSIQGGRRENSENVLYKIEESK